MRYGAGEIIMAFNKDAFLQQTVEQALDTKRIPFPEGPAEDLQIKDISLNSGTVKEGDNAGKTWAQLTVIFLSNDPDVREEMKCVEGQDATVRMQLFLDLTEEGLLDVGPGRNIALGKLRHAAGQNTAEEWSIMDLKGAMIGGAQVKHSMNKDTQDVYAEVTAVFAADEEEDE
jgi:hypothetical protein